MSGRRLPGHGLERGRPVDIVVDGVAVTAYEGESVAAAVMAAETLALRLTEGGAPRGYFCGMGVCFDCTMVVDGVPQTRTCMTWVREGMTVEHQVGAGAGEPEPDIAH
ncbi:MULTISPECIES: (2Fe-2S)-binding protein [unclassified Microbacterium]|uniref:(2Fe-2S)-binding protein n=1 Tax=unclassified Microbacterium TaxID=2609290 RepID=UPI000F5505F8|nr:(2Fe-2S)-binding protein [Microbacterium sp. ABRD28]AZC14690.1 (2Fe-2S)-binding protein [Microbacterium sp. ABRD28]